MKAIGYTTPGPTDTLVDIEIDKPSPTGHDLLVRVQAISVNPVDYKFRQNVPPEGDAHRILGWDAVGEVVATGDAASVFSPGDTVWYAGAINRSGTNAEYHVVDERIVGMAPTTATIAEATPSSTYPRWSSSFARKGASG